MKHSLLLLILIIITNLAHGQGIFAGSITVGTGASPVGQFAGLEMLVFSEEPLLDFTLIDWGDGMNDTLKGPPSFQLEEGLYGTMYNFPVHYYQDTGHYTIVYLDSFWVSDVTNFENSSEQPFRLSADIWLTTEFPYTSNTSVLFSSDADQIIYNQDGIIEHQTGLSDIDGDSISQKFIPVDASGYFIPDASNSIECCLLWDKPIAPGRYAFGFEFEDWRSGLRMGSTQRFVTVEVDSVISSNSETVAFEKPFRMFYNSVKKTVNILPDGKQSLDSMCQLDIYSPLGQVLYHDELQIMELFGLSEISLNDYPSGVYFATMKIGNRTWTDKFFVR